MSDWETATKVTIYGGRFGKGENTGISGTISDRTEKDMLITTYKGSFRILNSAFRKFYKPNGVNSMWLMLPYNFKINLIKE